MHLAAGDHRTQDPIAQAASAVRVLLGTIYSTGARALRLSKLATRLRSRPSVGRR